MGDDNTKTSPPPKRNPIIDRALGGGGGSDKNRRENIDKALSNVRKSSGGVVSTGITPSNASVKGFTGNSPHINTITNTLKDNIEFNKLREKQAKTLQEKKDRQLIGRHLQKQLQALSQMKRLAIKNQVRIGDIQSTLKQIEGKYYDKAVEQYAELLKNDLHVRKIELYSGLISKPIKVDLEEVPKKEYRYDTPKYEKITKQIKETGTYETEPTQVGKDLVVSDLDLSGFDGKLRPYLPSGINISKEHYTNKEIDKLWKSIYNSDDYIKWWRATRKKDLKKIKTYIPFIKNKETDWVFNIFNKRNYVKRFLAEKNPELFDLTFNKPDYIKLESNRRLVEEGIISLPLAMRNALVISALAKGKTAQGVVRDSLDAEHMYSYADWIDKSKAPDWLAVFPRGYGNIQTGLMNLGEHYRGAFGEGGGHKTVAFVGDIVGNFMAYAMQNPYAFYQYQKAFGEGVGYVTGKVVKNADKLKFLKKTLKTNKGKQIAGRVISDTVDIGSDLPEAYMNTPKESWGAVTAGVIISNYLIDYSAGGLRNAKIPFSKSLPLVDNYKLEPQDVKIDKYRAKEFEDLKVIVRVATAEELPIGDMRFHRILNSNEKLGKHMSTFFANEKSGMGGGSAVHEVTGVTLSRQPQDWEWYTDDRTIFKRAKVFFGSKGHRVVAEQGKFYVDGVKIDLNPMRTGIANIESVSTGDWKDYVRKSKDGVAIISPQILTRRALVGAFERGGKTKEKYARYSKDIPRLLALTKLSLDNRLSESEKRGIARQIERGHVGYAIELLKRYEIPEYAKRVKPIKYRGYEQIEKVPKLTSFEKKLLTVLKKYNAYLGGGSGLYFQFPFRRPRDYDILVHGKTPQQMREITAEIAKELNLARGAGSKNLLWKKGQKQLRFRIRNMKPSDYLQYLVAKNKISIETKKQDRPTLLGTYNTRDKSIWISPHQDSELQRQNTIAHEIQHYRQSTIPWQIGHQVKDTIKTIQSLKHYKYVGRLEDERYGLQTELETMRDNPDYKHASEGWFKEEETVLRNQINLLDAKIGLAWDEYYLKDVMEKDARKAGKVYSKRGYTVPELDFTYPKGKEILDIKNVPKKESVFEVNNMPVRDWRLVAKDKRWIIKDLSKKTKRTKQEDRKLKKAQRDLQLIEQGIKTGFPKKYRLKNRFALIKALGYIEMPRIGKAGKYYGGKKEDYPSDGYYQKVYKGYTTKTVEPTSQYVPPSSPYTPPYNPPYTPSYPPYTPPYNPPYTPPTYNYPETPYYNPPYVPQYPPYTPPYTPQNPIPKKTPKDTKKKTKVKLVRKKPVEDVGVGVIARKYEEGKRVDRLVDVGKTLKDAVNLGYDHVDKEKDTSFSVIPINQRGRTFKGVSLAYKFSKKHGRWYEKNKYRFDRNTEKGRFQMNRPRQNAY